MTGGSVHALRNALFWNYFFVALHKCSMFILGALRDIWTIPSQPSWGRLSRKYKVEATSSTSCAGCRASGAFSGPSSSCGRGRRSEFRGSVPHGKPLKKRCWNATISHRYRPPCSPTRINHTKIGRKLQDPWHKSPTNECQTERRREVLSNGKWPPGIASWAAARCVARCRLRFWLNCEWQIESTVSGDDHPTLFTRYHRVGIERGVMSVTNNFDLAPRRSYL